MEKSHTGHPTTPPVLLHTQCIKLGNKSSMTVRRDRGAVSNEELTKNRTDLTLATGAIRGPREDFAGCAATTLVQS